MAFGMLSRANADFFQEKGDSAIGPKWISIAPSGAPVLTVTISRPEPSGRQCEDEEPSGPITVPHHTTLDANVTFVRHEPRPGDVFLVELAKAYFPRLLIRNFFLGG